MRQKLGVSFFSDSDLYWESNTGTKHISADFYNMYFYFVRTPNIFTSLTSRLGSCQSTCYFCFFSIQSSTMYF